MYLIAFDLSVPQIKTKILHLNPCHSLELILSHAFTHCTRRTDTTLHHLEALIHIIGPRPFLMLDHIHPAFHLRFLDQLPISPHPIPGKRLAELMADQRRGVQARQRDELPAITQLRQPEDVGRLLGGRHGRLPIERRGQIVRQLLLGPDRVHAVREFLRLLVVRQLGLHPDHIRVRGIGDRTVDGAAAAALVAVVSLARAGGVPVPVDVHAREALGDGAGFEVGFALAQGAVFPDQRGLVDVDARFDDVFHGVIEEFETRLSGPGVFDCLELGARFAGLLCGNHQVVEWLQSRVRHAEDEAVISGVYGGCDEGRGFGVGPSDCDEIGAHDVCLGTNGHQTVDVFADGYEDLASHVATLFGARGLIFYVDACCSLLDEHLRKLHDCRQSTMASVGISDHGPQVINVGNAAALRFGGRYAFLTLLPIMKQLGHEKMLNFVGNRRLVASQE